MASVYYIDGKIAKTYELRSQCDSACDLNYLTAA